jgi:hypothetical protein
MILTNTMIKTASKVLPCLVDTENLILKGKVKDGTYERFSFDLESCGHYFTVIVTIDVLPIYSLLIIIFTLYFNS